MFFVTPGVLVSLVVSVILLVLRWTHLSHLFQRRRWEAKIQSPVSPSTGRELGTYEKFFLACDPETRIPFTTNVCAFRTSGAAFTKDLVDNSLRAMMKKHPLLRMCVDMDDNVDEIPIGKGHTSPFNPRFAECKIVSPASVFIDNKQEANENRWREIVLTELNGRVFDVQNPPLWCFFVVQQTETEFVFILSILRSICDDQSMLNFIHDFLKISSSLFKGEEMEIAPLDLLPPIDRAISVQKQSFLKEAYSKVLDIKKRMMKKEKYLLVSGDYLGKAKIEERRSLVTFRLLTKEFSSALKGSCMRYVIPIESALAAALVLELEKGSDFVSSGQAPDASEGKPEVVQVEKLSDSALAFKALQEPEKAEKVAPETFDVPLEQQGILRHLHVMNLRSKWNPDAGDFSDEAIMYASATIGVPVVYRRRNLWDLARMIKKKTSQLTKDDTSLVNHFSSLSRMTRTGESLYTNAIANHENETVWHRSAVSAVEDLHLYPHSMELYMYAPAKLMEVYFSSSVSVAGPLILAKVVALNGRYNVSFTSTSPYISKQKLESVANGVLYRLNTALEMGTTGCEKTETME